MPSYNSVFRYLEAEALTPYLYELITLSARPLKSIESDFAVDSSGFSTGQFMRWFDVKYGTKRRSAHEVLEFLSSLPQKSMLPQKLIFCPKVFSESHSIR